MPTVYRTPNDFVNHLINPGLNAIPGRIPLKQYVCLSKKNGGNAEIDALLSALRAKALRDKSTRETIDEYVGATELNLLWKGQGRPQSFIDVMDFLVDNKDQMQGVQGTLGKVYSKYFAQTEDATALKKMVADHYFGIDCIGFVANYLRFCGLWNEYKPYEIDQWDRVFTKRVNTIDDIEHLSLMVWPGSHVALVHIAWADDLGPLKCKVDICQSSKGGPQTNRGIYLTDSRSPTVKGYKAFAIEGKVPVGGHCYLMTWPELRYGVDPT